MATYEEIKEAMEELDDEALMDMANAIMDEGGADAQTCLKACQDGLAEVGARFESGEYFVGDLVFAGELMGEVMDVIKPALAGEGTEAVGKMILCTVKDDLHDIGKNIVRSMLEAGGMEVVDLGIDVPAQKIIEEAKKNGQWYAPGPAAVTEEQVAAVSAILEGREPAWTNFQAMPPSVKKTYARAYFDAKTDAGRERRIAWMADRLDRNLKPM